MELVGVKDSLSKIKELTEFEIFNEKQNISFLKILDTCCHPES